MERSDLVIDVGNSRTKLALMSARGVQRTEHVHNGDMQALRRFLGDVVPQDIVIGAVAKEDPAFLEQLRAIATVLVVNGGTPWPLNSVYNTPVSLGADRMANAVAGAQRFPSRPVLAIDIGTCITYDLVTANGTYSGGAISPGMRMRATAMSAFSARLPEVTLGDKPLSLGTTTNSSLEAGIHFGIVGELKEFIAVYGHEQPDIAVCITGGDALRFVRALKNGIFALPLLTLEGLHAILLHNRAAHGAMLSGKG